MVTIFIWAARLPAVAVGLYAVLASLVPLLSLPRPSLGAGAVYPIMSRGYGMVRHYRDKYHGNRRGE